MTKKIWRPGKPTGAVKMRRILTVDPGETPEKCPDCGSTFLQPTGDGDLKCIPCGTVIYIGGMEHSGATEGAMGR